MRRSVVVMVVAAAVCALALGGCAKGKSSSSSSGSGSGTGKTGSQVNTVEQGRSLKTVNAGQLTACVHMPKPPYAYQEGGDTRGVDVDLVRAVTGRLGVASSFRDVAAGQVLGALAAGQCDLAASGIVATDALRKQYEVSDGYFDVYQALLVRAADASRYHDLPDLKGHKVGVVAGSAGADFVSSKGGSSGSVSTFADAAALVAALGAKQVDGAVLDAPDAAYAAKSGGQSAQSAVAKVFTDGTAQHDVFVMPKGKTALRDAVNNALKEVRGDDSYRMIITNYLGTTAGQGG